MIVARENFNYKEDKKKFAYKEKRIEEKVSLSEMMHV